MAIITIMMETVGLVFGGLAAAALLCSVLWQLLRRLHHPEWGAPAIVLLIGLAAAGKIPHSEFSSMMLAFLAAAVVPFWIEGRVWRRHWKERATTARSVDGIHHCHS